MSLDKPFPVDNAMTREAFQFISIVYSLGDT